MLKFLDYTEKGIQNLAPQEDMKTYFRDSRIKLRCGIGYESWSWRFFSLSMGRAGTTWTLKKKNNNNKQLGIKY